MAAAQRSGGADTAADVIQAKLLFGGFGRRGLEAIMATLVLLLSNAIVTSALLIIAGSDYALSEAAKTDRPDLIQVKGRFNRALFETPRRGNLPPLTLPVYEPLIDPEKLVAASSGAAVVMRQSMLRNVVSPDRFLNTYLFGIEPDLERRVSSFHIAEGRFLQSDDDVAAVLDRISAQALSVGLGDRISVREADGQDLPIVVVGVLDDFELRDAPPRTIEASTLRPTSGVVAGGIFVTLRGSRQIFGRATPTDALVIVPSRSRVPALVDELRQTFRLEPGIFISERFSRFDRKVHDFTWSLGFFSVICAATSVLAGGLVALLLSDVYADRQRQHAILAAIGFSPLLNLFMLMSVGVAVATVGAVLGVLVAMLVAPDHFSMPSLMAELGSVEPRFNWVVGGVPGLLSIAACGIGLVPVAWRLLRHNLAAELTGAGP
jgi:ABC-type antimicrobial peptide transport system permease subunit